MKKVKKFKTYSDLKSSENKTVNAPSSLEKHKAFQGFIKEARSVINSKSKPSKF